MNNLLDITSHDIAALNDSDLRELIGRLCEADFRAASISTSGITWGGNQDAADGGIDVGVRSQVAPPSTSYIPRKTTLFQVKKSDMLPSKILKEMRPKGILRDELKELIGTHGAYVIVSSNGSTTEPALKRRVAAMQEALQDEPNSQQLHLDFFDRGRIATWLRSHQSLILWVRHKIGRPLQAWKPYDNWSNPSAGIEEEFIVDEQLRLYGNGGEGESIDEGIQELRKRLISVGSNVRLAGLSGVGKTRLVQALFDMRVGENSLDPNLAYYTDISDSPIPAPPVFASQLIASNTRAILIIDNCSPELHRTLTKQCKGSLVSLLTVEYDIRDDLPDETEVFRLEPSSDDLIKKLLKKRYPQISQINSQTIAEFANGNARVAIALANTLSKDESISILRDEELFKRLFYQRHSPDDSLRTSAEVCSLVYSFDGEDITSDKSELRLLATLTGKTPSDLYRDVAELKRRGLVQSRNIWRAVLPHAIANRLAKSALESLPIKIITQAFITNGSERLIKSFTRRLGYLHGFQPAINIAVEWLQPDGWLGKTGYKLSQFGKSVFANIAPLAPEATLSMLERSTNINSIEQLHNQDGIRLLRHLAYDDDLFQRSVRLLCRMALLEKPDINNGGSARASLQQLFHLFLSGTQAPPLVRAEIIDELLSSSVQAERDLGLTLLSASLRTHHFSTWHTNTFGARPRNYGYQPRTGQDYVDWFGTFLNITTSAALSERPIASRAKSILARHFRGLWHKFSQNVNHEFLEEIERSIVEIHSQQAWNEGWVAVKNTIHYHSKVMNPDTLLRLKALEQSLCPTSLIERARTYALTDIRLQFFVGNWSEWHDITRKIGQEVACTEDVFAELLPELVTSSHHHLHSLGQGLAEGTLDRQKTWNLIFDAIKNAPSEKLQINVALGFLSACRRLEADLCHSILDTILDDKILSMWFVHFQASLPIDKRGIARLHRAVDIEHIKPLSYQRLSWNLHNHQFEDDELALFLGKLLVRESGLSVVIAILEARFNNPNLTDPTPKLVAVSRQVLLMYNYESDFASSSRNVHLDDELAKIAKFSFCGDDGFQAANDLCRRLVNGFLTYEIQNYCFPQLLTSLAIVQPVLFLDTFIDADEYVFNQMHFDDIERRNSPINTMAEEIIIAWCEQAPETRFLKIVSSLQSFSNEDKTNSLRWHPVVYKLLDIAPTLEPVLEQLASDIYPMSWSGSQADAMARRFSLFPELFKHENIVVRNWAKSQHQQLEKAVKLQREREAEEAQAKFERFE